MSKDYTDADVIARVLDKYLGLSYKYFRTDLICEIARELYEFKLLCQEESNE